MSGTDASGVDFDAACVLDTTPSPPNAPAGANGFASPGGGNAPLAGCGTSLYDGSTESTDIVGYSLASTVDERIKATCEVEGPIPTPGTSVLGGGADLPTDRTNLGFACLVLWQNEQKQTNGDNPHSGCARLGGGRIPDRQGHWRDGFHNYLAYRVVPNGTVWRHVAEIGSYDPGPGGGFLGTQLGVDDGGGFGAGTLPTMPRDVVTPSSSGTWDAAVSVNPTTNTRVMTVSVEGIVRTPNELCVGDVHEKDYASHERGAYNPGIGLSGGDAISNVKAVTRLEETGSPYAGFSDTTVGGSLRGWFNTNAQGVAFSFGLDANASDTTGPTMNCPTPETDNPIWVVNQNQGCHFDDDNLVNHVISGEPARGTYRPEFWHTTLDFFF